MPRTILHRFENLPDVMIVILLIAQRNLSSEGMNIRCVKTNKVVESRECTEAGSRLPYPSAPFWKMRVIYSPEGDRLFVWLFPTVAVGLTQNREL
jgi:hypothetical protein